MCLSPTSSNRREAVVLLLLAAHNTVNCTVMAHRLGTQAVSGHAGGPHQAAPPATQPGCGLTAWLTNPHSHIPHLQARCDEGVQS